jgi:hypothetical protein
VVNDGTGNSSPAIVKITALNVIKVGLNNIGLSIIKVYPNPTDGILNIAGLSSLKKSKIVLYSIDGQLIRTKTSTTGIETMDINDQVPGIYFLEVNKQIFKILKE